MCSILKMKYFLLLQKFIFYIFISKFQNKLILHRLKLDISNKPIKLHGLIGGLEYSWSTILKHDTDMLSLLHDKEISKVTYLLLADITSNEQNFREWLNILNKECLQENRRFVMCLLSHILVQIGQSFSLTITEHLNVVSTTI